MCRWSKNAKLNKLLTAIEVDLLEMGLDEVKHYMNDFKRESDYNIVQYGNLLCYYSDVFQLYRNCGYTSTDNYSCERIWETYKRQVGYVARELVKRGVEL